MRLLQWAAAHAPDRHVHLASLAVRAAAAGHEADAPLEVLEGLRVHLVSGRRRTVALWHERTAVHGFVDLAPGTYAVSIDAPGGSWLPREVRAVVLDRSALRRSLAAGMAPAAAPGATRVDARMYPTATAPISSAETVLWGAVTRAAAPVAGAFIRVQVGTHTYRGASDARGVWCVWLRTAHTQVADGAREVACVVRAWRPLSPADGRIPHDFEVVSPGDAAFTARYAAAPGVATPTVPLNERTRVNLTIP